MSDPAKDNHELPPEQQAIRNKYFHPSGTFVDFPDEEAEQSIPQRFEKMVRLFPGHAAVETLNGTATYAELDLLSNQIAYLILNCRETFPEPVALLFQNGISLIAAMLGVLKAGKFFVLLDPNLPKSHLAGILDNSQPRLLLTQKEHGSLAQEVLDSRCPLLIVDLLQGRAAAKSPGLQISARAMAFILYTSGSTGHPKGVPWSHRNLLHHGRLYARSSGVGPQDRVTLLSSGTANAVTNALLTLLEGATLLPFSVKKEGILELSNWLRKERVSVCLISAALFRSLCQSLSPDEKFPDLRVIRIRSESVHVADVELFRKYFPPPCVLVNGLSTTETGLLRVYVVDHRTEIAGTDVPVGFPVDDKEITLIDEHGDDLGFNQVGEIVVKSAYIADGYWRDPAFTFGKFKTDASSGKLIYFTGDLGILRSDGCLIHKGRKDFRLKVRGYGVEIAGVERALRDHPAVIDVVVVGRENKFGEARLVAYFTCSGEQGPNTSELRDYLSKILPDYMIPAKFVRLPELPLASNGKVDRNALPAPSTIRPELGVSFLDPTTPVERVLAQVWSEVLGIGGVGVQDDFFDLGGDSLLAARVVSQVIKIFQVELPLPSLFRSPTIAEMAEVIMEHRGRRLGQEELERLLGELDALSEEEAQRRLAEQVGSARSGERHA